MTRKSRYIFYALNSVPKLKSNAKKIPVLTNPVRKREVCIYYKEHASLIKRDDTCPLDNYLDT